LEKNPSLADHTRELHLFPSFEDWEIENESEGYAQFLSCFQRLEKVSLNGGWGFREDALSKALAKLETLKSLTLSWWSLMSQPKLLTGEPEPDQSSTTPAFRVQNNDPPVQNRVPLSLSLGGLGPEATQAFARLVRERRGIFKSHWIENLNLILPSHDNEPLGPVCRACCELLQAVEATQRGSNGAEPFSRFTFEAGEYVYQDRILQTSASIEI
jgi:hypothetical protein